MQNSNSNDGTEVPTSTTAEVPTSSQTIAKPNVRRCLSNNDEVFVLSEYDPEDGQTIVIGVADSWENADTLMSDYYKDFKVIKFQDIRDSGIEWTKNIEVSGIDGNTYPFRCILQSFRVNNAYGAYLCRGQHKLRP